MEPQFGDEFWPFITFIFVPERNQTFVSQFKDAGSQTSIFLVDRPSQDEPTAFLQMMNARPNRSLRLLSGEVLWGHDVHGANDVARHGVRVEDVVADQLKLRILAGPNHSLGVKQGNTTNGMRGTVSQDALRGGNDPPVYPMLHQT